MDSTRRTALERAFPVEERDAMTSFVIDNRSIIDVMQMTLEHPLGVERSGHFHMRNPLANRKSVHQIPEYRARLLRQETRSLPEVHELRTKLKGGQDQVRILLELAVENGFTLEQGDRAEEFFLIYEGQQIKVECDVSVLSELAESGLNLYAGI